MMRYNDTMMQLISRRRDDVADDDAIQRYNDAIDIETTWWCSGWWCDNDAIDIETTSIQIRCDDNNDTWYETGMFTYLWFDAFVENCISMGMTNANVFSLYYWWLVRTMFDGAMRHDNRFLNDVDTDTLRWQQWYMIWDWYVYLFVIWCFCWKLYFDGHD